MPPTSEFQVADNGPQKPKLVRVQYTVYLGIADDIEAFLRQAFLNQTATSYINT